MSGRRCKTWTGILEWLFLWLYVCSSTVTTSFTSFWCGSLQIMIYWSTDFFCGDLSRLQLVQSGTNMSAILTAKDWVHSLGSHSTSVWSSWVQFINLRSRPILSQILSLPGSGTVGTRSVYCTLGAFMWPLGTDRSKNRLFSTLIIPRLRSPSMAKNRTEIANYLKFQ